MVNKIGSCSIIVLLLFSCNNNVEKEYYKNGNTKTSIEFKNSKRNGLAYEYFEDGQTKSIANWKNDVVDGKVEHYYRNGQLKSLAVWKNGKLDGVSKSFYKNGKIKSVVQYRNGKMNGPAVFYSESGLILEKRIHENGSLVYIAGYDSSGNLNSQSVIPIISALRDTITLNEIYTVEISFGFPLKGKVILLTGNFDKNDLLTDTTAILYGIDNRFKYSVKPDRKGAHIIPFLVNHNTEDTLSANGVLVKHTFYVKDN